MLHDRACPYADALECLARLRAAGKQVVLLSNSGKRTAIHRARLAEIGIDAPLYDAIVTSGEATWQALARRTERFFAAPGRRRLLWSRYGDRSVLEGLPLAWENGCANVTRSDQSACSRYPHRWRSRARAELPWTIRTGINKVQLIERRLFNKP